MADPGFPIGGGGINPLGGPPTSDTYTFQRKNMQKRKKLILLGGGARTGGATLDPPMLSKKKSGWVKIADHHPAMFPVDGQDFTIIQVDLIQMDDCPDDSCAISPTAFLFYVFTKMTYTIDSRQISLKCSKRKNL